jgi:hypothetical protein
MTPFQTASERARAARRARGGAMVEFVILNIVLVPLLLYAIFLMDAAYLKLDLQETVVSGVWDFSQRNTEPPSGSGSVGPANSFNANNGMELQATAKPVRIVYSDHTSAFDDGAEQDQTNGYGDSNRLRGNGDNSDGPTGHKRHHTGFGAQYTFRFKAPPANAEEDDEEGTNSGGALDGVGNELDTQFKCRISTDMGWSLDPNMTDFGQSGYNAGGEARCESIGFIYNYIVPEKFLQEFSETDKVTNLKRRRDGSDGAHEFQGQGGRMGNIIAEETAALSFNTWALRNGAPQKQETASGYGASKYTQYDGDDAKVANADIGDRPSFFGNDDPKDNPFFRRVQYMYSSNLMFMASYANVAGQSASFMGRATNQKLVTAYAAPIVPGGPVPPTKLPVVGVPNLAGVFMAARYKPGQHGVMRESPKTGGFLPTGGSFLTTPYTGHNNNYQTAANARGPFYMGCRNQENPDCF